VVAGVFGRAVRRVLRPHPAQVVLGAFALAILLGTGLLMLPISVEGPGGASFITALFTATSAVCVTGHVVVDTATYWTPFGQGVILALIQVGGLGVMSVATIIGVAIIGRLSIRTRLNVAAEAHGAGVPDVKTLTLGVLRIGLSIELIAAGILTAWFAIVYAEPPGRALWLGVFHAVSSFNNAGFALFSDNMMGFATDPVISLTICASIILGGLGFPVIVQLLKYGRTVRLWSMNTRIVVSATLALLVLSTVFVTVLEWDNPDTLGPMTWPQKLLVGFFQAVQTRTAGFNSVDIGSLLEATLLGMDIFMFIGGGPAGTAGGIKVTTFAVLYFILWTEIRGGGVVNVFGKRLSRAVHREAISVALISIAVVVAATLGLLVLSGLPTHQVLFEAISAFGTVGLSTGITASLPPAGQLILVLLMFVGRLGPITFASALALREKRVTYEYPKERPVIG
jgi:trk system potassium uptake protein